MREVTEIDDAVFGTRKRRQFVNSAQIRSGPCTRYVAVVA